MWRAPLGGGWGGGGGGGGGSFGVVGPGVLDGVLFLLLVVVDGAVGEALDGDPVAGGVGVGVDDVDGCEVFGGVGGVAVEDETGSEGCAVLGVVVVAGAQVAGIPAVGGLLGKPVQGGGPKRMLLGHRLLLRWVGWGW